MFPTEVPYAVYFDKAGAPLDNGYLYFGVENQNPETSSLQVFWDLAGTQPVAQPVRTIAGYPVRAGTIANIYANAAYSQTVRDSKGNLVSYSASSTARNPFGGTTSFALTDTEAISTTTSSFRFTRNANYAGGTPGYVNACVIGETFVNNATASSFEWAGLFVVHSNASGGQNVGVYGQGNALNAGSVWGGVMEVCDATYANSAGKQGLIGLEVDCYCNDADPSGNRVGIQIIAGDAKFNRTGVAGVAGVATNGLIIESQVGGNSASFINGIVVDSATGVGVVVNTANFVPQAFRVQNKAQVGFDTSAATIGIAALRMAQGQSIAFNATSSRQLTHDGSGFQFFNPTGPVNYWGLADTGALLFGTKQLLGAQVTGYALMTGTVNRATVYDTSTITLQQLAQRFAAFQNDVMNFHGFIHT